MYAYLMLRSKSNYHILGHNNGVMVKLKAIVRSQLTYNSIV